MELRPYQRDTLEAIRAALEARVTRQLIRKATGTGKTVTFAEIPKWPGLKEFIETRTHQGARMLVIAHREELLEQGASKIRAANPGLLVAIEQAERIAPRSVDVVVASVQTLVARDYRRLERLLRAHSFPVVIIDEAHHTAAASYRGVLVRLGILPPELDDPNAPAMKDVQVLTALLTAWDAKPEAAQRRLLVGVTATPNRTDAIGLNCAYQDITFSYGLKDAIGDGWLVPIKPWVIETKESLVDVKVTAGDFNQKDLAAAVNKERRNRLALDAWTTYASDRSTIGFTVDVAHAHAVAEMWRLAGVNAAALSGETPKEDRRRILADYAAGRVQVLANCMVLTEGTDLPITGCILHLKPTKSATLYEQMCGRGLRLFEGKDDCIVLDLVDVARKNDLQTAPALYGLPPGMKTEGQTLQELQALVDGLQEQFPTFDIEAALAAERWTVDELKDRASTFDVFKVPPIGVVGEGLTLRWIKLGGTYRVDYPWTWGRERGRETLRVSPDLLDHFVVTATFRPFGGQGRHAKRQTTIAAQAPSARAALEAAEAFVQFNRRTIARLKDQNARWRSDPASPGQVALLLRKGILAPKNMTKGQASDALDMHDARRGHRRDRR